MGTVAANIEAWDLPHCEVRGLRPRWTPGKDA